MRLLQPTWRPRPVDTTEDRSIRSSAAALGDARRTTVGSLSARLVPILFFEAYLLASVLVFAFGPVEFEIYNPMALYSYVLAGQFAIFIGYWFGALQAPRGYRGTLSSGTILSITIVATLALLPPTILQRNRANISLGEALLNPGAAYAARAQELQDRETAPLISVVRVLAAPVLGLFIPLGILYGPQRGARWRWLWRLGLAGIIAEPIFTGAAKGIFDLVLVVPWLLWLRMQRANERPQATSTARSLRSSSPLGRRLIRSPGKRQLARLTFVTVAAMAAALTYFSYSRQSRYGLAANEFPAGTTGWSTDLYGMGLPPSIEYPVYMVSRYLSQGYVGLSESLDLPFEWCYGIGHSMFWMRYAGMLVGDGEYFLMRSYPYRLEGETGYSAAYYWHTIYPWLASDLTFPGAILFIGVLGYLLARAWCDTLFGHNPFAAGFLAQILLMFYYIPANNGRLMFSEEAMMFWGLLILWLATRGRPKVAQPLRMAGPVSIGR